jgi:polyhydroxybutyrate depolymerase
LLVACGSGSPVSTEEGDRAPEANGGPLTPSAPPVAPAVTTSADAQAPHVALASTGCGASSPPPSGTYQFEVGGTQRSYIVSLPDRYDPNKPHRLVLAWHGLGVSAAEVAAPINAGGAGFFGMLAEADDSAIFVAGQGLAADLGLPGWPDTDGRDVAFARQLIVRLAQQYCLDETRIFSAGMSYGAVMTNRLGCALGDTLRAIASMSGAGPLLVGAPTPRCTGQVAVWLSHGTRDDVMPLSSGERSRDYWRDANHCAHDTEPTQPSPCITHRGCDAGFPVTWCAFDGGHERPGFSPKALWQFFAQF